MMAIFNKRCALILREIVKRYISSAEPVGSRFLSKNLKIDLSPATIRNVMTDLEEMGYLQQIHISSGRIPTDKGYRFYVDNLLEQQHLFTVDRDHIDKKYLTEMSETEYILKYTSKILSGISHCTGIVMLNRLHHTIFKHMKIIKLNPRQVLIVFISKSGVIHNRIVETDLDAPQDKLDTISKYLNDEFNGLPLRKIRDRIKKRMMLDKKNYNALLTNTIELIKKAFIDENSNEIYLEGIMNIFDHPDFVSDISRVKALFKEFDEKNNLIKLLDSCLEQEGAGIIIGLEGEIDEMQPCSMITHTYQIDDTVLGVLGIVGPKRMEYEKIIPMVTYTARLVSSILSDRITLIHN